MPPRNDNCLKVNDRPQLPATRCFMRVITESGTSPSTEPPSRKTPCTSRELTEENSPEVIRKTVSSAERHYFFWCDEHRYTAQTSTLLPKASADLSSSSRGIGAIHNFLNGLFLSKT